MTQSIRDLVRDHRDRDDDPPDGDPRRASVLVTRVMAVSLLGGAAAVAIARRLMHR